MPISKVSSGQNRKTCRNTSTSYQQYSFPKKQRFSEDRKVQKIGSGYFVLPGFTSVKNRGPSFTKSLKRMRFENQQEKSAMPAPNLYSSRQLKKQYPGFSLGKDSRKFIFKQVEKTPGPAAYTSFIRQSNSSPKFSQSKRQFRFPDEMGKDSPGPYPIPTERIKSILSNYKKQMQTKIPVLSIKTKDRQKVIEKIQRSRIIQEKKLQKINSKVPSSFGRSIFFKNQKIVSFDKEMRKSWFEENEEKSPGPANYEVKGQFAKKSPKKDEEQSRFPKRLGSQKRWKTLPIQSKRSKGKEKG